MSRGLKPGRGDVRSKRGGFIHLLLVALPLFFATYFDVFLQTIGGPEPAIFQYAAIGTFSLALLFQLPTARASGARYSPYARQFLLILIFYAAWTVLSFSYSSQSPIALETLKDRVRVAVFIAIFVHVLDRDDARILFERGSLAIAVIGAFLNFYDFFNPTFSTVPGRAAGLYGNPTISGFMLVSLGILGIRTVGFPLRQVVWALISLAVVITFSRSAWLFVAISTIMLAAYGYFGRGRVRYVYAAALVLFISAIAFIVLDRGTGEFVARSSLARYLNLDSLQRLGATTSVLSDYSSRQRADVARLGLEYFANSPFFGCGLGFTREWDSPIGTHNMYVLMLAEGGLLGGTMYAAIIGFLIFRGSDRRLVLGLVVLSAGFFTHNLLDAPGQALILAAAAVTRPPLKRAER